MRTSAFWNRVRLLIREKHVTQATVAKACGLPYSTFKRWITKNIIPTLDVASLLSQYFEVSLDYLVYGKKAGKTAKIKELINSLRAINKIMKNTLQQARTKP